jgi:UPF0755 protein
MKKLFFLVIFLTGVYFFSRILLVWNVPNSELNTRVSLEIPKGATLSEIAAILKTKGLVRDEFVFRIFAKWNNVAEKFQAGEFIIQKNLKMEEISDILQHGKSTEMKITIPEGSTIAQIDTILSRKSLIKEGEFKDCASFCDFSFKLDSLEGFLLPSTYFVNPKTFSVKGFIKRLHTNFNIKIDPFRSEIEDSSKTLSELVIIASMIEREANLKSEMPQIADVIYKRLKEGIALGIDATTRYELDEWKRSLFTEDFESASPYNTRRNRGLPPTAISNFSTDAFLAALRPEKNDFYYYLHDKNGTIHFAKDLAGHNENKRLYLGD